MDLAQQREARRQKILERSSDRLSKITSLKSKSEEDDSSPIVYSTAQGESKKNEITSTFSSPTSPVNTDQDDGLSSQELFSAPLEDASPVSSTPSSTPFFTFRTLLVILLGIVTVYLHEEPHLWVHSQYEAMPLSFGTMDIDYLQSSQEKGTIMESLLSMGIPIPRFLQVWSLGSKVWLKMMNSFYDDVYTFLFVIVVGITLSTLST